MTAVTSPNAPLTTELTDNTHVTTLGAITAGSSQIPVGVNGTVVAAVPPDAEVLFGPPINATEIVSDSLLAVA